MEPEGLLPCSKELPTGEPDESSPHLLTPLTDYVIALCS